ncbi:PDZ domain-containing protein [Glaciecola siphonariae]|uniref:PDZ domain-containing protein n=1 Tax=Glaciecola siphonariae TaxID=521012 RepID=A0ABV9LWT5_9ALTE
MGQKFSTAGLLLCLLAAVIYSLVSLHEDEQRGLSYSSYSGSTDDTTRSARLSASRPTSAQYTVPANTGNRAGSANNIAANNKPEQNSNAQSQSRLPISLKLIGTNQSARSSALIESQGIAEEFALGELIFNWPIQLVTIESEQVSVGFDNQIFVLNLVGPNLLAKETQEEAFDFYRMSAEDIGTRPKIIEHIVNLTPTDFIADGMIASVGMNPSLFAQAGLQEDDVIKMINGKRVTVEDELADVQSSLQHSSTIVFTVERKGRMITLYLDIPSEALTITR